MPAPFASASPRRRLLLRVVTGTAAVAALGGAVALGGQTLTEPAPAAPQDRPGPVLLVPGYGGSTAALSVLAARLEAEGRQAEVVPLPGDGTGDLREAAAVLAATAERALAAGAPSVDVVGFSAGGVTARLYAEEGGAPALRRVVTLGSPHHGTRVAGLAAALAPDACVTACQQLVPGSPLLSELNGDDETPDGPRWVTLWTRQDEVVTPPESTRLDGAVEVALQDVCPGAVVAHGDLPRDPLVAGIVLSALGPGEPAAPAASECAALRARGAALR